MAESVEGDAKTKARIRFAVQQWIDTFLAQSPEATQATKQCLNLDILAKAKAHMDEMLRLETVSWKSPNHPEAVRAILDKRPPRFSQN